MPNSAVSVLNTMNDHFFLKLILKFLIELTSGHDVRWWLWPMRLDHLSLAGSELHLANNLFGSHYLLGFRIKKLKLPVDGLDSFRAAILHRDLINVDFARCGRDWSKWT